MTPFTIEKNSYLKQNIQGFYHTHFGGVDLPNNPNFLYKLKNDPHHNWTTEHLKTAITEFANILIDDLPKVQSHLGISSLKISNTSLFILSSSKYFLNCFRNFKAKHRR